MCVPRVYKSTKSFFLRSVNHSRHFSSFCLASSTRLLRRPLSLHIMTHCVGPSAPGAGVRDLPDEEWKKRLTPQQYRVLRMKGTDPLHGPLDNCFDEGVYHCAGCHTALYNSNMKWPCGCGWPGFWDCLPNTVREVPDADGNRIEILCHSCNSHLGHIFRGEGFKNPPPNERHCVNSTSLIFVPSSKN